MMFVMGISPTGVAAIKLSRHTSTPSSESSALMYWRVSASAAEPGGRGPDLTMFRKSSKARGPLKAIDVAV
jgi:hypothetical protein